MPAASNTSKGKGKGKMPKDVRALMDLEAKESSSKAIYVSDTDFSDGEFDDVVKDVIEESKVSFLAQTCLFPTLRWLIILLII